LGEIVAKNILKLFLKLLLLFVILIAIIFAYGRMRSATAEQQQALALLEKKPAVKSEENVVAYIWSMTHDVPQDKIESLFAADVAKLNALKNTQDIASFKWQAKTLYPEIDYRQTELEDYCNKKDLSACLSSVQRDQTKVRLILDSSQVAIARAEAISSYRSYYSPMEQYIESPLPSFQTGQTLLRVHYADLFVNGQQQLAMTKICRDIDAWRSIGANTDSLIGSMIGHAYVRADLSILADMLTRVDGDEKLPAICMSALKPIEYQENMVCDAIRGEFEMIKNFEVDLKTEGVLDGGIAGKIIDIATPLVYDHTQLNRKAAPFYSIYCNENAVAAAKQQKPAVINMEALIEKNQCDFLDKVSNSAGCILFEVALSDYSKYSNRRLDQSAQVTAMQIVVWLRERGATKNTLQQLFAERPNNLRTFSDRIQLNAATGMLEVNLLSPSSDGLKTWAIPLPPRMKVP
jgi:hypothetical protein